MPQAITLTEKQLNQALAISAQSRYPARDRIILILSFYSGMRVGEIASLLISDVLNNDGKIKDRIQLLPHQTKGNNSRTVVVNEKLKRELKNYIQTLKGNRPEQPLIFSQRQITGFTPNTLCQHFRRIYRLAALEGATSHSGRRTFITTLANKGVGVRVLMALAGHRNMSTTQRYIDINDDMLTLAANLL